MSSNAWTHRRGRLPRPPVCKSYPRIVLPPGVQIARVFCPFDFTFMGINAKWLGGVLDFIGSEVSGVWQASWLDDFGNVATGIALIAPAGPPASIDINVPGAPGGPAICTGLNDAWPGSRPFSSSGEQLLEPGSQTVGNWNYQFL